MELELKFYSAICHTEIFNVNGVRADESDFGDQYDTAPEAAEAYGCGNMQFDRKPSTPNVFAKYGITEDEYAEICDKLEKGLSFGRCGWCV